MAGSSIHHRLLFKNSPLGMFLRFNNSHAYFSAIKIFEIDMLLYFLKIKMLTAGALPFRGGVV